MNKFNFTILGLMLICFACLLGSCHENGELRQNLKEHEVQINNMRRDHELAMAAADEALAARKEIANEEARKAMQMEQALSACPDFSSLDLPPDVLRLLKEQCDKRDNASGGTALRY